MPPRHDFRWFSESHVFQNDDCTSDDSDKKTHLFFSDMISEKGKNIKEKYTVSAFERVNRWDDASCFNTPSHHLPLSIMSRSI